MNIPVSYDQCILEFLKPFLWSLPYKHFYLSVIIRVHKRNETVLAILKLNFHTEESLEVEKR